MKEKLLTNEEYNELENIVGDLTRKAPKLMRKSFFDAYVFYRDFVFDYIDSSGDFEINSDRLEIIFEVLRELKLIDRNYIDNLSFSLLLRYNLKEPINDLKVAQALIDKKFKPDPRQDGWQFYDKLLSAIWVLILKKNISERSAQHLLLSLFGSSEKKVRDLCSSLLNHKELTKLPKEYTKDFNMILSDVIMLLTAFRICDKGVNVDELKPRSKRNHLSSVKTHQEAIKVFKYSLMGHGFLSLQEISPLFEKYEKQLKIILGEVFIPLKKLSKKKEPDQLLPFDLVMVIIFIKLMGKFAPQFLENI